MTRIYPSQLDTDFAEFLAWLENEIAPGCQPHEMPRMIAIGAYMIADRMLEERNRK
jgi:hypothetical protein